MWPPVSKPQGLQGWIVRANAPDTATCHVLDSLNAVGTASVVTWVTNQAIESGVPCSTTLTASVVTCVTNLA